MSAYVEGQTGGEWLSGLAVEFMSAQVDGQTVGEWPSGIVG